MPEFDIGQVTKPTIAKRCAICNESIDLHSPEIVCFSCKRIINWLKENQFELAHIIAKEKNR